jgi:glycosyltransferase involved in cell wall biosynthesis
MNEAAVRLAIVGSHPVQYYAPWFRYLAAEERLCLRTFYLWGGESRSHHDPGFDREIAWDLDLLSGYEYEFVPNTARRPGTAHFNGLVNPALPSSLRAWRPDVILVFGYGWRSLATLALNWKECPLVLRGDTHLLGRRHFPIWRRAPQRWVTRRLLQRYAAFASVGKAHTGFLLAHGVSQKRIFNVPHCVDNDRWRESAKAGRTKAAALRAELGLPPEERVVLFAGKFEAKKQPHLLLDAFLRTDLPSATLLMVGDGPLRAELQASVSPSRPVRWLPFQNQTEMPRIYAAANLFVLPSAGHGETWGLAVNEAMASGVPCIVSDQVGCRADLISEGETGWSFPATDAAALAARLREALAAISDPNSLARIRAAIAARIDRYSYHVASVSLIAALDTAIQRTR